MMAARGRVKDTNGHPSEESLARFARSAAHLCSPALPRAMRRVVVSRGVASEGQCEGSSRTPPPREHSHHPLVRRVPRAERRRRAPRAARAARGDERPARRGAAALAAQRRGSRLRREQLRGAARIRTPALAHTGRRARDARRRSGARRLRAPNACSRVLSPSANDEGQRLTAASTAATFTAAAAAAAFTVARVAPRYFVDGPVRGLAA